jgi:hypothetical protein
MSTDLKEEHEKLTDNDLCDKFSVTMLARLSQVDWQHQIARRQDRLGELGRLLLAQTASADG